MPGRAIRNLLLAAGAMALAGCSIGGVQKTAESVLTPWSETPHGKELGQTTGLGVDSRGDVWVFHRAGRQWSEPLPTTPIPADTVAIFDGRTGALKRTLGAGLFAMPHGLTVDADDNIWLTDVALHQVFKLSPDGRVLMVLGERGVAGDDARRFNRPTDVALGRNGDIQISDGYRNARVIVFAADGAFRRRWGRPGAGPGAFDLPHAISVDAEGRVYVADRSNRRIQIFDAEGRFLAQWKSAVMGRPYAVTVAPNGGVFVADGEEYLSRDRNASDAVELSPEGRILRRFVRQGSALITPRTSHDIAVDGKGAVYVINLEDRRVWRSGASTTK